MTRRQRNRQRRIGNRVARRMRWLVRGNPHLSDATRAYLSIAARVPGKSFFCRERHGLPVYGRNTTKRIFAMYQRIKSLSTAG